MTSRPSAVRRVSYGVFRRLPPAVRRTLVRVLTPNYTLGAVVLVRDAADELLLLRQPRSSGWSLPGGLMNHGETPAEAAARELTEETGLEVPSGELVAATPNARVMSAAQQVDVIFMTSLDTIRPGLALDPVEVAEAGWYPLDALPRLTYATAELLGACGLGPAAIPPTEPTSAAQQAPAPLTDPFDSTPPAADPAPETGDAP